MEAINSAITESGSGGVLPTFGAFMGFVELLLRVAVMAGPLLLLGFGLIFLLAPPKEANYGVGYRFWWGMASLAAWKFTQRLAGIIWTVLGLALTVVMFLLTRKFAQLTAYDVVWTGVKYILWEVGLVVVSSLFINTAVMSQFTYDGELRRRR